jgi:dTDP-4-amino-4,6-dideoxygalactose transaminase
VLPVSRPSLPELEEYVALLQDIWQSRMLSNFGKYAQLFERKAQGYLGNPFTRAVVNCDAGLILALAALEVPEGGECLVQAFTFNSTINAILWNRLRPGFVDIDPRTLNVDCDDLERRITPATRAIVVTHIFGSPLDIGRVMEIAARRELPVVVDAAHAYGAQYGGRPIGDPGLGNFQVFSWSGTKQLTSGEGGLIAAAGDAQARRIEYLRAYGFQNDYVSEWVGLNGKLSELHAALGCLTMDRVEEAVASRQATAGRYRDALGRVPGVRFQEHLPGARSTYKDFAILCPKHRDELAAHLDNQGIQSKKYFRPLHTMPAFERFRSPSDDLADTEAVAEAVLCLPMFNELRTGDVDRVCYAIRGFYGRG